jgi:hypothetical protein
MMKSMQCTENFVSVRKDSDMDALKQITCRNNRVTKRELYFAANGAGNRGASLRVRPEKCEAVFR